MKLKHSYKCISVCLIALFSILFTFSSKAQLFSFRNFSLDDGLTQSEINCIFEDSRGYLWVGTAGGGLGRFDGKEFKTYEETDGLCGQFITAIFEDHDKKLIIGTQDGKLCKFDGEVFKPIIIKGIGQSPNEQIKFITRDDANNLIIGQNNRILKYTAKKFEPLPISEDALKEYTINCHKNDSRNILWIGTSKGLLILKNQKLLRLKDIEFLDNSNITSITEDTEGNIWVVENRTTFYKVKIINSPPYQATIDKIDFITLPARTSVNSIYFDYKNRLWIATKENGVYKFSKNKLQNFNKTNGFPVDDVNNIFQDRSNNLWFGTRGAGLAKYSNQAFTYFDNLAGFSESDVFTLTADQSNNIWVGTNAHGIFKYDGSTVQNISETIKIGDGKIGRILCDSKGNIWVGSINGLTKFDGKNNQINNKELTNVRALFEDKSGNIWIGTSEGEVFVYNGENFNKINENILTTTKINAFNESISGEIWISTSHGIYIYKNNKIIKHFTDKDGLCSSYISNLVIDDFENVWIASNNCLMRYDGKSFEKILNKEGDPIGIAYFIIADDAGDIWVGTNKGVDKVKLTKNGEIDYIRNYGRDEGFKGVECNENAACLDREGYLWFATIKGIIKIDPKELTSGKTEIPTLNITDIKLFYSDVDWKKYADTLHGWYKLPQGLKLAYNENHLTFDFIGISKILPEQIRYSFKLEGFDKEWSPYNNTSSTTYSNLPPGKYRFLVTAENKEGFETEPQEFSFEIQTPFWSSWWFISLCVTAIFSSIYAYNRFRKHKHKLFRKRLEKIIKQRTKEIIKQRDEKEVLLKEIHHRVKNNLQIINSLINLQSEYINDPKLSEFFREIRNRIRTISLVHEKLYKSSDFGNVDVKEYINMLIENLKDTYIIEKDIKVSLKIDSPYFNLNTIIPLGLLLNEIITNTFKSAFSDVENGKIEIELHKSSESNEHTLLIGDDGKGFDHSLFYKENPTLGLELIKILAGQLHGSIELIEKPGTYYILKFTPIKD